MLKDFTPPKDVDKEELKTEIKALREKLLAQQQMVRSSNLPIIVLVEGWAAAGKGSLINELINDIEINSRILNLQQHMQSLDIA